MRTLRQFATPLPLCAALCALSLVSTIACDSDNTGGPDAGAPDSSVEEQAVTINFAAVVGTETAACGETYLLGTPESQVAFVDARLFLSNIRLITSSGEEVPLELDQDTPFQTDNVVLLDFEDGTGGCAETGTTEQNHQATGKVPRGAYAGLAFDLGVPFELNHGDPLEAPSPLNVQALAWNWLSGHKFARIDLAVSAGDAGADSQWNFHLGSTGCSQNVADGGALNPIGPPDSECGRPNRASYEFPSFDLASESIVLDLAALFAGSDVSTNLGSAAPGCMSFPADEPDCTEIYKNLGLSFSSGQCLSGCANQSVFSVQ